MTADRPPGEPSVRRTVSGWGRYPAASTDLYRPERAAAIEELVRGLGSVIPRGLGRSYGDAAVNGAGATVLCERLNRFLDFDPATGVLECEGGVTVEEVLAHFVPRGFFPPVTPGTKFVTLGGALACDVHGKNHHHEGAISRHVLDFHLVVPSGERLRCSREENPELFWATLGGMGLTGFISQLRLRLRPMESEYVLVDYDRAPHLDRALRLFDETDDRYAYSVAWIDCSARGGSLGRSVLMRGNPAPASTARNGSSPRRGLGVPADLPGFVLNPLTIRAFNSVYYHRHPKRAREVPVHFEPFFYPLDSIRDWNRIYGRRGFVQYQFVLPHEGGREGLIRVLDAVLASGFGSFLAVLKRFGGDGPGRMLSFPSPGYTLALDFPYRGPDLLRLLDRLDEVVIEHGGRVYLAKDARLRPEAFRAMYPELPRWLGVKRRVDPENRFSSDLSRRLEIAAG